MNGVDKNREEEQATISRREVEGFANCLCFLRFLVSTVRPLAALRAISKLGSFTSTCKTTLPHV
jgi:hypothetical protein